MSFAPIAIDCLSNGVSVEIVGRPGSGRSAILDDVCAGLRTYHLPPIRIYGIGALRDRPLATLLASVPDLGRQTSICDSVAYLREEVSAQGVLAVDDADDLDDVSAGVLAAVRITSAAPMIVTRRTGLRPTAPQRRLLAGAQPTMRHLVRPLSFGALRDVLEQDLGAPIDAATMARIATMSGGLPGMARAISLVARRTGRLTLAGDVWAATGSLWSARLGQAVEALLVDASAEDVDALTLLAVAGPFDFDDARALISGARIERLNELGLLDVIDGTDEGVVGLYPPIVGEYMAGECTSSKRAAIRRRLVIQGRPMPVGLSADDRTALPADDAILSRTVADRQLAEACERLAVWEAKPTATAAVPLLAVLLQSEEPVADPADIVARTDGSACTQRANIELAAWHAMYQAMNCHDRSGAGAILDDIVRRFPAARGVADAVSTHLDAVLDRVPDSFRCDLSSNDQCSLEVCWGVSVEVKVARGEAAQALAEVELCQPENAVLRYHGDVCRSIALLLDGQVCQAYQWAKQRFAVARRERSPGALQSLGYVGALMAAVHGDIARLDELSSLMMTITAVPAFDAQYRAGIVGLTEAKARWLCDDVALARNGHDAGGVLRGHGPFPFMVAPASPAAGTCGDALWATVESAAERGYLASAAFALVEAAEAAPDVKRLSRALGPLEAVESPLSRALVRLAQATVEHDVESLAALEDTFAASAAWLYACRAGIAHALALRESGDHVAFAHQARRVWERVIPRTRGLEGMFARLVQAIDLTPREAEIAWYAVDGLAAVDIADALVLSARTVEHHLFKVYRKIGVDSRKSLRGAFETWLRSVPQTASDRALFGLQ